MKLIKNHLYIFLIIGLIILDQLLKIFLPKDLIIINGILKLTYTEAIDGELGVVSSNTIMQIISNIIILAMIVRFIIIQKDLITKTTKIGAIFILAGGISNLIDKIFRGFVINYIDISQIINIPVFNLADIILTIGWISFIIGIIFFLKKEG